MTTIYQSENREQTQKIASDFAQNFKKTGGLILFHGEMGAGKTTFTQGFIKAFGIAEKVISPTFLLQRQYQIPETDRVIFHLDLYRLAEPIDLNLTGISELFSAIDKNIVLIEWSEKLSSNKLPPKRFELKLSKSKDNDQSRTIEIISPDE